MKVEKVIGEASTQIAEAVNANAIVSMERSQKDFSSDDLYVEAKVIVFRKIRKGTYGKNEYFTKIKKEDFDSMIPIKNILMTAITKRIIKKGDRVVCTQDESMGASYKGLLVIFDVDKLFFDISKNKLAENISPDIIETVIDIALEIGKEGREGKHVGTAFIIGNSEEISKHTKQMIINPFKGIDPENKNISDPDLRETIKEFSQLDGVFILNVDGTVQSAGTYLDVESKGLKLTLGMGTKHRNCAAITNKCDAIAVVVSESGGKIRVFKKGSVVMTL